MTQPTGSGGYPPAGLVPAGPMYGTVDAAGVVTADLPCRKCAYNLRGLSLAGRCPECGSAVGLSVQGDLLRFSDPAWVRTLRRGARFIIYGVAVIILGVILGLLLAIAIGAAAGALAAVAGVAGYVLTLVGTWLLTEPDPSGIGEDRYGTSRKLIRITLMIGVAGSALDLIQEAVIVPPTVFYLFQVLALVAEAAFVVGLFAELQYLWKLALRIPDVEIAGRAQSLRYPLPIGHGVLAVFGTVMAFTGGRAGGGAAGAGGVMAIGCAAAVVGLYVLVLWLRYLRMIDRIGRRFGEEARAAEETWARVNSADTAPA